MRAVPGHVALLRGINVGGKNRVPMAALPELFAAAGAKDARTYLQSGNVVYRAPATVARRVPALVREAIAERLGLEIEILGRTGDELAAIARACPFTAGGKWVHVLFLASAPPKAAIAKLDPARSPPDEFAVQGREVYLHLPNGGARTKLSGAYFESKLKVSATGRNWNTLEALRDLAAKP